MEWLAEPDTTIKAGSITVPTAQALNRRGMRTQLAAASEGALARLREFTAGKPVPRMAGHFAGIFLPLEQVDPAVFAAAGDAPALTLISQAQIEQIVAARAVALGVEIRRGVTLTGFAQDHDSVRVELGPDPAQVTAAAFQGLSLVLVAQKAELEAWRELSLGTDLDQK